MQVISKKIPRKQVLSIVVILVVGAILAAWILGLTPAQPAQAHAHGGQNHAAHGHAKPTGKDKHDHAHAEGHKEDHAHAHEGAAQAAKGEHGGELLQDEDLSLEVLLAPSAGATRFSIWPKSAGKPLPPASLKLSLSLLRPDGSSQEISFKAQGAALVSEQSIAEPHHFSYTIAAHWKNTPYLLDGRKEEGKIAFSDAQIKASGIGLQVAGPATLSQNLQLPGEIRFNEDQTAHVVPRLAGVVESISANLGQQVQKGQLLAVVASTQLADLRSEYLTAKKRHALARQHYLREKSLWEEKITAQQDYLQASQALHEAELVQQNAAQKLLALGVGLQIPAALHRFEIRAPFAGMVVEKHLASGESIKEDSQIFTISNLATVWAEIVVPAHELGRLRLNMPVKITATAMNAQAEGKLMYIGSLLGEQTRTAKARVLLNNPQLTWRPGLFVNAALQITENQVALAIPSDALQQVNQVDSVFLKVDGGFVAQPVVTGRRDGKLVEILRGIPAQAQYAASNSFVIKAELGKASAEHAH